METIIVILLVVIIYMLSSLRTLYINVNKKLPGDPDDNRNYKNTLYPVVCENTIIYKGKKGLELSNKILEDWNHTRKRISEEIIKIKKDGGKKEDFTSDKIDTIANEYCFGMWLFRDNEAELASEMQANIDVLNGKKLKEVEDNYYKTKFKWDRSKFDKETEEHIKDLIAEHWDKPEELVGDI